ncbi:MAG: UvrD-helicase domain-containing protein [Patescibacteria group bacterium]
MEIRDNLNKEQRSAVEHTDGPLLIIAGAGTGKTTVIAQRVAWLIEQKLAKPDEILALTFTDKAAEEMEERVDRLLPYGYVDLWVSTFHAFGERILRDHAIDIGLDAQFKILQGADQWLLLRDHLNELELDYYRPLGKPTSFLHALVSHFSRLKDENIAPKEYLAYAKGLARQTKSSSRTELSSGGISKTTVASGDPSTLLGVTDSESLDSPSTRLGSLGNPSGEAERINEAARSYEKYEQLLRQGGHLDFGDLIIQTLRLFTERKAVLKKFQDKFKYILVDEFQDTNMAQYDLVRLLSAPKNNITVCGDDDQSIYKFRGAAVSNILEFKKDYPKAKEVVLTENYRSTQPILDLAHSFIQLNNPNRLEARLSGNVTGAGREVEILPLQQARGQDDSVSGKMKNIHPSRHPESSSAREGSSSDKGVMSPINKKLKSQTTEKGTIELITSATADDEIRSIIAKMVEVKDKENGTWDQFAILVRANNMADEIIVHLNNNGIPYQFVAARGLFQRPEILDLISYLKLLDNYHESPAVYRVLTMPVFNIPMPDIIDFNQLAKRKGVSLFEAIKESKQTSLISGKSIAKLLDMVARHSEMVKEKSAGQVLYEFIKETNLFDVLQKAGANEKALNISKFYKFILEFERNHEDHSVHNFIQELGLLMDMGEDPAPAAIEEGPESVKIMTVHGAKGLEFEHVFLPHLVHLRFPSVERKEQIMIPDDLVREVLLEGDMHLEEERRLMYVALTRARRNLYLSWAKDMGGARAKKPSRFLHETGFITKEDKKAPQQELGLDFVPPVDKKLPVTNYRLPVPNTFSFTQLQSFERCPKQYRYAHILKIPTDSNPQFVFGRSVHNTLKAFYGKVTDKSAPTEQELIELYNQHWISDWYPSQVEEGRRKAAGREALKQFYAENKDNFRAPKYLEKPFTIKVGKYSLRGVIDRVDSLAKEMTPDRGPGQGVEIIDYKTGKVPKDKRGLNLDQLMIYAIAAREVFNDNPARLTYYYLEAGEQKLFDVEDKELAKVKDKVLATIEEIKQSDFKATPGQHVCRTCDFRFICEDRVV